MAFKNLCYGLAQEGALYICNTKRAFILLLLAFFLSTIAYFSLEDIRLPRIWLNKVINQTHKENNKTLDDHKYSFEPLQNQQIQKRATDIPIYFHVAHPSNYYFILDEPDKCKNNPFLVLLVPVAPHQIEARNAIRNTWGNETTVQGKAVLTLFLVGLTGGPDSEKVQQQLGEESRQYRDLIQSNFVDSYFNLTIKTMIIMGWLSTHCPQANYSMKIDSDMFLNVNNLVSLLMAPNTPRENYITGMVMWNRPVVRSKDSKWYVSEELYSESTYPTYLLGMGYVFSNDMPAKIVEASKVVMAFNIEDAYIGACIKQMGVEPSSPPDPSQFRAYLGQYVREDFFRVITTILGSPQQLIDIWKDINRPT